MRIFWGLLAATVVSYVYLIVVAGAEMQALAPAPIPDVRITGYTLADMRALLDGAAPEFAQAYRGVAFGPDLVFPVLAALTFAYGLWIGSLPRAFVLLPILMGLTDLTENYLATQMFLGGVEGMTEEMVNRASAVSRLKWALYPISALLVLIGLVRKSQRQRKRAT